jgi:DNA polymerase III alpha subunit (gram-positive type)
MGIVYFDLETGGLEMNDPIIQLAAVATDSNGEEVGTFQRLVRFEEAAADPDALKLNHYNADRWAEEAWPERNVFSEFAVWLERYRTVEMTSRSGSKYKVCRLAAYNAPFDAPRLQTAFSRNHLFLPAHPQVLCVMQLAMWSAEVTSLKPKTYKLVDTLAHFVGAQLPDAHDALADVRATATLAKYLMPMVSRSAITPQAGDPTRLGSADPAERERKNHELVEAKGKGGHYGWSVCDRPHL